MKFRLLCAASRWVSGFNSRRQRVSAGPARGQVLRKAAIVVSLIFAISWLYPPDACSQEDSPDPPPCMEWKYDKDAGKLVPKPVAGYDPEIDNCCNGVVFNPDTEGCCKKQDGTYEVTDNPKNADPCQSDEMKNFCERKIGLAPPDCMEWGQTICYNGQKVACVCECRGLSQGDPLYDCIIQHEGGHTNDANLVCSDCETKEPDHEDDEIDRQNHCALYRAALDCAEEIPGGDDDPQVERFKDALGDLIGFNGC